MKNLFYLSVIISGFVTHILSVRSEQIDSNTRRFRLKRLQREWQECRDMSGRHVTQEGSVYAVVPVMPDDWLGKIDRREGSGRKYWRNQLVRIVR